MEPQSTPATAPGYPRAAPRAEHLYGDLDFEFLLVPGGDSNCRRPEIADLFEVSVDPPWRVDRIALSWMFPTNEAPKGSGCAIPFPWMRFPRWHLSEPHAEAMAFDPMSCPGFAAFQQFQTTDPLDDSTRRHLQKTE